MNAYSIYITDNQETVSFSVEFPKESLRAIRRVIRSHLPGSFPVEKLDGGLCRISIQSGKHGVSELRSLYDNFHHGAQTYGL
jgi:hypothetical protein